MKKLIAMLLALVMVVGLSLAATRLMHPLLMHPLLMLPLLMLKVPSTG